jgi:polynucleotide 5'-kinase involved in rRNA processing
MNPLDLPAEWEAALAYAPGQPAQRIVVIGATDTGKSSFIRALALRRPELALVDLDPGQKMVGPPGTASRGRIDPETAMPLLDRFIFLGTTSASALGAIARAAAMLTEGPAPLVVNTAGFVKGLGARLQALTIRSVRPDLIVALGEGLEPILEAFPAIPTLALPRPEAARRKSPAARTALRQAAFEEALRGGAVREVAADVALEPGPPLALSGERRPVCALADAAGEDMALGILETADPPRVFTSATGPIARIRLGRMWAHPSPAGWKLQEKLAPSWQAPAR